MTKPIQQLCEDIFWRAGCFRWRQTDDTLPQLLLKAIEQDFYCAICGLEWTHYTKVGKSVMLLCHDKSNYPLHATVDHIVPRSISKDNSESNKQAACYRCNHLKSNLPFNKLSEILLYQALESVDILLRAKYSGTQKPQMNALYEKHKRKIKAVQFKKSPEVLAMLAEFL